MSETKQTLPQTEQIEQTAQTEQDLVDAIANSQETLGASIPRLVTQKPQIAMNAIKHQLSGQRIFMPPDELAEYIVTGYALMETMRPVGIFEIQTAQRIVDIHWFLNRAVSLCGNITNSGIAIESQAIGADHPDIDYDTLKINAEVRSYEKNIRQETAVEGKIARLERIKKMMTANFEQMVQQRIRKRGDKYDADSCSALFWYRKLGRLVANLTTARAEVLQKSVPAVAAVDTPDSTPKADTAKTVKLPKSTTSASPLFFKTASRLASPLTPETISIFNAASAQSLLTAEEVELIAQSAAA